MRIWKLKAFDRVAKKADLGDDLLRAVVAEMESGLTGVDLGGNVFKVRVARRGAGKSGGYRVLLALKRRERTIFLYAFAKKDKGNVSHGDLARLKILASDLLGSDERGIEQLTKLGELIEVRGHGEAILQ